MSLSREAVKNMLKLIKDTHGLPTAINDTMVSEYQRALNIYDQSLFVTVADEINKKWDKRYLPQISVFVNCCNAKNEAVLEEDDRRIQEERAWKAKKFRNNDMLVDICRRLRSNQLTDEEKEKVRIIDGYMKFHGEKWYKEVEYTDSKKPLNPITASFIGLYMDLPKPLTGKKGGINITL